LGVNDFRLTYLQGFCYYWLIQGTNPEIDEKKHAVNKRKKGTGRQFV